MEESVNRFIKHTIVNLQGALDKDNNELTLAVLTNLANVIESYVEAMQDELELV
jgi:hypothetical protein